MIRKEAVKIIAESVGKNPIISANGFMSRDLFETNEKESNFYMSKRSYSTHYSISIFIIGFSSPIHNTTRFF